MVSELIELSAVIGEIYDAATEPALWQQALASICSYVGGSSAALLRYDGATRRPQLLHRAGDAAVFSGLSAKRYLPMHPMFSESVSVDAGRVASVDDIMPRREFVETSFYREWAEPQGIADALLVNLDKDATHSCLIDIPVDVAPNEHMRQRLAALVPHLQRAVARGRLADQGATVARTPARRRSAGTAPTLEAMAKRYSLTASEVRVLDAVLRVNGVRAVAERLGLSQSTVKTHLHNLFRKTGTGGQSDLVKLVAGM